MCGWLKPRGDLSKLQCPQVKMACDGTEHTVPVEIIGRIGSPWLEKLPEDDAPEVVAPAAAAMISAAGLGIGRGAGYPDVTHMRPGMMPGRMPGQGMAMNPMLMQQQLMSQADQNAANQRACASANLALDDIDDDVPMFQLPGAFSAPMVTSRLRGIILRWPPQASFGFIMPQGGTHDGEQIFCHKNDVESGRRPKTGDEVEYFQTWSTNHQRPQASGVRLSSAEILTMAPGRDGEEESTSDLMDDQAVLFAIDDTIDSGASETVEEPAGSTRLKGTIIRWPNKTFGFIRPCRSVSAHIDDIFCHSNEIEHGRRPGGVLRVGDEVEYFRSWNKKHQSYAAAGVVRTSGFEKETIIAVAAAEKTVVEKSVVPADHLSRKRGPSDEHEKIAPKCDGEAAAAAVAGHPLEQDHDAVSFVIEPTQKLQKKFHPSPLFQEMESSYDNHSSPSDSKIETGSQKNESPEPTSKLERKNATIQKIAAIRHARAATDITMTRIEPVAGSASLVTLPVISPVATTAKSMGEMQHKLALPTDALLSSVGVLDSTVSLAGNHPCAVEDSHDKTTQSIAPPMGFDVIWSTTWKRWYFFNVTTGEKRWAANSTVAPKTVGPQSQLQIDLPQVAGKFPGEDRASQPPPPAGWGVEWSKTRKRWYFFDKANPEIKQWAPSHSPTDETRATSNGELEEERIAKLVRQGIENELEKLKSAMQPPAVVPAVIDMSLLDTADNVKDEPQNKQSDEVKEGIVCMWDPKGWGFIAPTTKTLDGKDIFCHRNDVIGQQMLKVGQNVRYGLKWHAKKSRYQACDVANGDHDDTIASGNSSDPVTEEEPADRTRLKGTIIRWNVGKLFGFIKPCRSVSAHTDDIFCHSNEIEHGRRSGGVLRVGDEIEYFRSWNKQHHSYEAVGVVRTSGFENEIHIPHLENKSCGWDSFDSAHRVGVGWDSQREQSNKNATAQDVQDVGISETEEVIPAGHSSCKRGPSSWFKSANWQVRKASNVLNDGPKSDLTTIADDAQLNTNEPTTDADASSETAYEQMLSGIRSRDTQHDKRNPCSPANVSIHRPDAGEKMHNTNTHASQTSHVPVVVVASEINHQLQAQRDKSVVICRGVVVDCDFNAKGTYFPGKVGGVNEDGSFDIEYDDGDKEAAVPRGRIRLPFETVTLKPEIARQFPAVGTTVQCFFEPATGGKGWEQGRVSRVDVANAFKRFWVEFYEDGWDEFPGPVYSDGPNESRWRYPSREQQSSAAAINIATAPVSGKDNLDADLELARRLQEEEDHAYARDEEDRRLQEEADLSFALEAETGQEPGSPAQLEPPVVVLVEPTRQLRLPHARRPSARAMESMRSTSSGMSGINTTALATRSPRVRRSAARPEGFVDPTDRSISFAMSRHEKGGESLLTKKQHEKKHIPELGVANSAVRAETQSTTDVAYENRMDQETQILSHEMQSAPAQIVVTTSMLSPLIANMDENPDFRLKTVRMVREELAVKLGDKVDLSTKEARNIVRAALCTQFEKPQAARRKKQKWSPAQDEALLIMTAKHKTVVLSKRKQLKGVDWQNLFSELKMSSYEGPLAGISTLAAVRSRYQKITVRQASHGRALSMHIDETVAQSPIGTGTRDADNSCTEPARSGKSRTEISRIDDAMETVEFEPLDGPEAAANQRSDVPQSIEMPVEFEEENGPDQDVCPFCLEPPLEPVTTPCQHTFCTQVSAKNSSAYSIESKAAAHENKSNILLPLTTA
jgi:cold shock CspA family protein